MMSGFLFEIRFSRRAQFYVRRKASHHTPSSRRIFFSFGSLAARNCGALADHVHRPWTEGECREEICFWNCRCHCDRSGLDGRACFSNDDGADQDCCTAHGVLVATSSPRPSHNDHPPWPGLHRAHRGEARSSRPPHREQGSRLSLSVSTYEHVEGGAIRRRLFHLG